MAIQFNDITEIGDVFEVHSNIPIVGIQSIIGFTDVVLNETVNRYFVREFCYSLNGITYSDWLELSDEVLLDTFVPGTSVFDIRYRYTRSGTDSTGYLTFVSIQLIGVIEEVQNPDIFTDLYFNKFFNYNDDSVLRWAINVLNKLYNRGIIANYVERGVEGENDEDFLSFFGALTHFMAILVRYAREFKDFTLNDVLLTTYLRQKGIFVSDGMRLVDLQTLLANVYNNFIERGTNKIVSNELLRLLRKSNIDEFVWGLIEPEKTIWNVGNNSPMYRGTKGAVNLIKAYEFTKDVTLLDSFPLVEPSFITKYTDSDKDVLRILNASALSYFPIDTMFSGIGDAINLGKSILIDSRLSYEITFQVKQAVLGDYLSLNVYLYDKDENLLTDSPISAIDGSQTNVAIGSEPLLQNGLYYFVRIILFNENIPYNALNIPDIGFGNHMIINNSEAKFMSVELGTFIEGGGDWDGYNDLRIYDFKVRPLMTQMANGFVMIPNIITSFIENNSEEQNKIVENKIKRFLIPYNSILINQFLDELTVPTGTPLRIVVSHTNETLIGADNGTITIIAIGGTMPYQYSVDNGSTFQNSGLFTNLSPATYNILVKDKNDVEVTDTVVISQGVTDLDFNFVVVLASRLDVADGIITVLASGGILPYFYSRNGIDYFVSNVLAGILPGNYTVYVKDTNGDIVNKPVVVGAVRDKIVTFNVVNENSVVIASAIVSVISENYSTNILGVAVMYLENGSYNFSIVKSGYRSNVLTTSIAANRNFNITLQTYYSITFTVKNSGGTELGNTTITTQQTPATQNSFTVVTPTGSGIIVKTEVIAGYYEFVVSRTGYSDEIVSLTVDGNENFDIVMAHPLFTLSVIVQEQSPADPIFGGLIIGLSDADVRYNGVSKISSNAVFTFAAGTYNLLVSRSNHETISQDVLLDVNKTMFVTLRKTFVNNTVRLNNGTVKYWSLVLSVGPTSFSGIDNGTGFCTLPLLMGEFYTFTFTGAFGTKVFTNVPIWANNYLFNLNY